MNLAEQLRTIERALSQDMVSLPRVQSPLDGGKHPPMNRGADKMHPKGMNYSHAYAEFLADIEPKRLVELGVFTGVSMALWSQVFPAAEIIGLDINLNRVDEFLFKGPLPLMYSWDAFDPQPLEVLQDVDVFIDDGPHVTEAVVKVAKFMKPRMAPGSRFIVEDMANCADILREVFPEAQVKHHGKIGCAFL